MTNEKLDAIFCYYDQALAELGHLAVENVRDEDARQAHLDHCRWMCWQARGFIQDDRREKSMRWLGYVQGMLRAYDVFKLCDLKLHSRPESFLIDGRWVMPPVTVDLKKVADEPEKA